MNSWPTQANVRSFFGEPGGPQCTRGKVVMPYPLRVAWDLKSIVKTISCHEKCDEAFTAIFKDTLAAYGLPKIQALGLDIYGGCYNFRKMRGGNAWSMHSWGIAIDLDPTNNALKMTDKTARFARPEYKPFWEIVESYGMLSLGRARNYDWMHFQAARL